MSTRLMSLLYFITLKHRSEKKKVRKMSLRFKLKLVNPKIAMKFLGSELIEEVPTTLTSV